MTTNDIGTSVYIATSKPATDDAAGFAALTWTRVNGVQSVGEMGLTHAGIDVDDLGSGVSTQVKGMASGRDTTMVFRHVASDTGQGTLKTQADDADGVLSVKVGKGSGADGALASGDAVEYFHGIVHSHTRRERSGTSNNGFSVVFHNNIAAVTGTQPA